MQDTVGPTDSQGFHSLFLLFCWKILSTQNLRPLDIHPGFRDILQVSEHWFFRNHSHVTSRTNHQPNYQFLSHCERQYLFYLCGSHLSAGVPWKHSTLLDCRFQGPKEKPRILPLMVPERKGNGTAPLQSTGPKGLHYSVSAVVWLRVIFRRKLYFDLCSQSLFLEVSFQWLFDFEATYIPS